MRMNRQSGTTRVRGNAIQDLSGDQISRKSHEHERRAHRRYAISAELEYRITRRQTILEKGCGQTIDVSTTGVLFETSLPLPLGQKIELSIAWPARVASSKGLELFAEGRVVRTEHNRAAVFIKRYAFR